MSVETAAVQGDGAEISQALDRLAAGCRILEMEGHASRILGHASLRDPLGRGLWLKRWGISFGETMGAADFVLVDFDGNQLAGDGKSPSEWPIHAGVLKARADVVAVVHSHPFYGRVFSAVTDPLLPVSNTGNWFPAPPPRFEMTSELIRTIGQGDALSRALVDNMGVFLRNHGVVFCGGSIEQAILMGVQLEEACREHLLIASTSLNWDAPGDEERARKYKGAGSPKSLKASFDFFVRELARRDGGGRG